MADVRRPCRKVMTRNKSYHPSNHEKRHKSKRTTNLHKSHLLENQLQSVILSGVKALRNGVEESPSLPSETFVRFFDFAVLRSEWQRNVWFMRANSRRKRQTRRENISGIKAWDDPRGVVGIDAGKSRDFVRNEPPFNLTSILLMLLINFFLRKSKIKISLAGSRSIVVSKIFRIFLPILLIREYYFSIRCQSFWGYSSVGRASRSQWEGQGFESPYLHHSCRLADFSFANHTAERCSHLLF